MFRTYPPNSLSRAFQSRSSLRLEGSYSTTYLQYGNAFFLLGVVFHVTGMFSPYWIKANDGYMGLWTKCNTTGNKRICTSPRDTATWVASAQVFTGLALFLAAGAAIALGFQLFKKSRHYIYIASTFTLFAGISSLTAVMFFDREYLMLRMDHPSRGWSIGMSAAGAIFLGMSGIALSVSVECG